LVEPVATARFDSSVAGQTSTTKEVEMSAQEDKPINGKHALAKAIEDSAKCVEVEDFPVAAKFLAALKK